MMEVEVGPARRHMPETWDELSPQQYLDVVATLHSPATEALVRIRLLRALLRLPWQLLAVLEPFQLAVLQSWLLFLFAPDTPGPVRQLLPTLRLPWRRDWLRRRWIGPRDSLRNLSFGEFIFADTYFCRYVATQQVSFLDKLVATLYRRPRRDGRALDAGDARRPFNEHLLDTAAGQLTHLPLPARLGIVTWYAACRHQLQGEFPDLFEAAEEDAETSPAFGGGGPDWGRVLRKLSGGAFGTVDQTAGQPLRLILAQLQDLALAARRKSPTA